VMMKEGSLNMRNDSKILEEKQFKLLIVGNKNRFFHLKQFMAELEKIDIQTKLIYDLDYIDKFIELNFFKKNKKKRELEKILNEFKPDVVLLDRISKIGEIIDRKNIPIWILLRGNWWEELEWAKKTIYKSKKDELSIKKNKILFDHCLKKSELILPISKYLEKEVKKRYPVKNIQIFPADGRNPDEWKKELSSKLKHPCVGLVQGLNIWGKTRELLTLNDVMKKLPEVTFYLAGDGIYNKMIVPELEKNSNFIWLKNLNYPNEVKEFLSEIDIFLLLSGLEGLGQTIIESLLMKKPTIASNCGGIPELIIDNETGMLVETGDSETIIKNIRKLSNDPEFGKQIAEKGHNKMKKEFAWKEVARKFKDIIETVERDRNIE